MENEVALVKKARCPKGQTRNKQGDCVAKKEKVIATPNKIKPKKPSPEAKKARKTVKTNPKNPSPEAKKARKTVKTNPKIKKQVSKTEAAKLLAERRKCIERFRNK